MTDTPKYWARVLLPEIRRAGKGTYQELERALEQLPVPALRDLNRLLRDMQDKVRDAERTFRPFPGGPRMRM